MPSQYRRYGLAALIYAAGFAYILLRWDAIPDPVPIHIGPTGEADGFAPKTLLSTTMLMIVGVVLSAVMRCFCRRDRLPGTPSRSRPRARCRFRRRRPGASRSFATPPQTSSPK